MAEPSKKSSPEEQYANEMMEVHEVAKSLPPQEASILLRKYFDQKIATSPYWNETPIELQRQIVDNFVGVQSWQPKNFGQRVVERVGWGQPGIGNMLGGAVGGNIGAGVGQVADEAMRTFFAPANILGETIDTAAYDMRGKQRPITPPAWSGPPTGGHLREMLPQTPGQSAEFGMGFSPQYLGLLRRILSSPGGIIRGLRDWSRSIEEGRQAAATENMLWQKQGRLRALPPGGTAESTRLPYSPYPMPGRVYSPVELRPPTPPSTPPKPDTSSWTTGMGP